MTLRDKINSGKFVKTFEVAPPKGISLEKIVSEISPVKNKFDAVNVTDLQSSVMRMSSLGASIILKKEGMEPIFQITCRDRNRLALQSDILSASAFGIENILALTGDHPVLGDHPQAKPVFDLDSIQLIEAAANLKKGIDMNGNPLTALAPDIFIGAVVNPGADPIEPEIIKMEKKIQAGAEFFQTQVVFDLKVFERFLKQIGHLNAKILAGVMLLRSEKMARHMNEHVPGVYVPDSWIEEIRSASDKKQKSVQMTAALIKELKTMCAGVHIMPISWYSAGRALLEEIGG